MMKVFRNFQTQLEPGLFGMVLLRVISSMIELTAAIAMFYFNDIRKALVINSFLAVVGPLVFISATSIGLISVANTVSFGKLSLIIIGVIFILIGILK
ncbi:YqhV family protein [Pueribacillus sp. YX66]|uniref:YqhV family protein n=1 Tax=Pueribacillus sp. YX66 TaxID=3229242 RepID=UPI0036D3822B